MATKKEQAREIIFNRTKKTDSISYFYRILYYMSIMRIIPNYLSKEMANCYVPKETIFASGKIEKNNLKMTEREFLALKSTEILRQASIAKDSLKAYRFTVGGTSAVEMLFPNLKEHYDLMEFVLTGNKARSGKILETMMFLTKSGINTLLSDENPRPILTKYPDRKSGYLYPFVKDNVIFYHSHELKRDEDNIILDSKGNQRYGVRVDVKGNILTGAIFSNGGVYVTYSGYDGDIEPLKNQQEAKTKGLILQEFNATFNTEQPLKPEEVSAILIVKDYETMYKALLSSEDNEKNNRYASISQEALSFFKLYDNIHILTYSGKGYKQMNWLTQRNWLYRLNTALFGRANIAENEYLIDAHFVNENRKAIQFLDNDIIKLNRIITLTKDKNTKETTYEIWCLEEQVEFLTHYCKGANVEIKVVNDEVLDVLVDNTALGGTLWG